jgi:hypothetical protein
MLIVLLFHTIKKGLLLGIVIWPGREGGGLLGIKELSWSGGEMCNM